MASIDGKEEHDAFNRRMEEKQPSTTQQVPKIAPVASSSNSNVKEQPQAHNKGKARHQPPLLKARATESQRIQQDAMQNVFQMACEAVRYV
ncbi:hypothetical protein O181_104034 [Austropuccinia psidii MF-1]|uniref:Uncharacterized protein n=1 Tax=Austropuccinia psidii MF-1 TaxID=1389203 RepID=A0A9Q3PJS4_9BASI|nr:hypothetical protein [Austropuccinia psidii MF-1]